MNQQKKQKGIYVAIEGVDGSGKSTVAELVAEALGAYLTREPGGSPLAEAVRGVLLSGGGVADHMAEFSLFWASRFALVSEVVLPRLNEGISVVSDRSDASTFAYQLCGEELGKKVPQSHQAFWAMRRALPKRPDIYVLLEVPLDVAAERRKRSGRAEQTNHFDTKPPEFFKRLQAGYEKFFDGMPSENLLRINANRPKEEIPKVVEEIVVRIHDRL